MNCQKCKQYEENDKELFQGLKVLGYSIYYVAIFCILLGAIVQNSQMKEATHSLLEIREIQLAQGVYIEKILTEVDHKESSK
jgi:hypothetical protein